MSKHTPGPWYPDHFEGISIFHDVKDRRFPVCRIEPISEGEGEANAHLIAAAPDLLEACKRVLSELDYVSIGAEEDLRAAIAKAEGE